MNYTFYERKLFAKVHIFYLNASDFWLKVMKKLCYFRGMTKVCLPASMIIFLPWIGTTENEGKEDCRWLRSTISNLTYNRKLTYYPQQRDVQSGRCLRDERKPEGSLLSRRIVWSPPDKRIRMWWMMCLKEYLSALWTLTGYVSDGCFKLMWKYCCMSWKTYIFANMIYE